MKLSKTYEPREYEPAIYGLWESSGAFKATGKGEPYSIALPPPNANGNLHLGHALTVALEDILIRYHRMKGYNTAFIPGADHAGFETWVVYEKQLEKEGKSRFDFSREELYSQVWDFVEKQRGNMELQLRELGASVSWDDMVFTLDEKVVKTAYETFKKMWDDDLIYRGERLVNYCTKHQTSFADIEVNYEETKSPLYYMKYGPFELATTRPETKFGDTAVAVHPDDERYAHLVDQEIEVQGVNGPFRVKVVADSMVDRDFGTGVVKITPAHDFNDWEVAQRHDLPAVKVIDEHGKLTEKAGRFAGMPVLEAREAVVEALKEKGLLIKVDHHYKNRIGKCYKCGTQIEPMLMEQWFIRVKDLAEKAKQAIENSEVTFTPKSKGKELVAYFEQLKDWNISRQPAWGIPIPAFQNVDDPSDWIFDTRVELSTIEKDGHSYKREEDTFDTWFSSGQWPYVVTDYLTDGPLKDHYPLSVMETGHDLLRPWVARMLMFGLYRTDQVPFKHVYMHGMVLDEKGQKMSKSKGNVLNPQEIVEQYGSDAMRMGIVSARTAGQNQPFSSAKVIAGRNFCNKLWNMARFIESQVGDETSMKVPEAKTPAEHWVIERLNAAIKNVEKQLKDYRFAEATDTVYHAVWDDVADWYLEAAKSDEPNKPLLAWVLETMLKLAHPFAPFVSETIWQTLKWEKEPLISQKWPSEAEFDAKKAKVFQEIQALVVEARFVSAELGSGKQSLVYSSDDTLIKDHSALIARLARLGSVTQSDTPSGLRLAVAGREAWLAVDEETLYDHQTKLEVRLAECREAINKLEARLSNSAYVKGAPPHVVEETREQLKEQQALQERLVSELDVISAEK